MTTLHPHFQMNHFYLVVAEDISPKCDALPCQYTLTVLLIDSVSSDMEVQ